MVPTVTKQRTWPALIAGLAVAAAVASAAIAIHRRWPTVSPHVVAVAAGIGLANLWPSIPRLEPGLAVSGRTVLRMGVVLMGVRLSVSDLAALGVGAIASTVAVVALTFVGIRALGRLLGLDPGLSLLVAVGFSICGASAIAAARPLSTASDEEAGYAVGLVTICGTLAIWILPMVGRSLGMTDADFGLWVGASVHDVGQVVAAASTQGDAATESAVMVKLARVSMLAPLLALLALGRGRPAASTGARRPLVPWFVALFLAAVSLRSLGLIPVAAHAPIRSVEAWLLAMGMVGLGSQVRMARLATLGARPLLLGLAGWVLVAGAAWVAFVAM
ncbi:MAG: YeiH family protein [Acidimicrobiia bacterium]